MKAKTTKTKAPTGANSSPAPAEAPALSFGWEDVAPGLPRESFREVHRFTEFSNQFFAAFGEGVPSAVASVLAKLAAGERARCGTLAAWQFWCGLAAWGVRFAILADKISPATMERRTNRAVAEITRFKERFPDLAETSDEAAFCGAFGLDLYQGLMDIYFAPDPLAATSPQSSGPTPEDGEFEITQQDAAKDFGVCEKTIRRWENGESKRTRPAGYSRETRRNAFDFKIFVEDWKRNKTLQERRKNLVREDRNGMTIHKGRG